MTLVLVHGCGTDRHFWDELVPHLGGLEHVALSLPGRDGSSGDAMQTAGEAAAWLRAQLCARSVAHAVVVGHSYGGGIAIEFALQQQSQAQRPMLDGLVLVATGARLRVAPPILDAVRRAVENGEPAELSRYIYRPATDRRLIDRVEGRARNTPVAATERDWLATDAFDRFREVAEIRARTLVVGGDEDQLTPPKYAQYLARQITGARLEVIAGAGHMLPIEHARELGGLLRGFVEGDESGASRG